MHLLDFTLIASISLQQWSPEGLVRNTSTATDAYIRDCFSDAMLLHLTLQASPKKKSFSLANNRNSYNLIRESFIAAPADPSYTTRAIKLMCLIFNMIIKKVHRLHCQPSFRTTLIAKKSRKSCYCTSCIWLQILTLNFQLKQTGSSEISRPFRLLALDYDFYLSLLWNLEIGTGCYFQISYYCSNGYRHLIFVSTVLEICFLLSQMNQ